MDRFKQMGKSLHKDLKENEFNTKRIQANLPSVERKLDLIAGNHSYLLEFPLSDHKHHVDLTLKVRPDNCCDCVPGAETRKRDGSFFFSEFAPPQDGSAHPVVFDNFTQTGSIFSYGYNSPFFHPFYYDWLEIGEYELAPDGAGVKIPIDGIYSTLWKQRIATGQNDGGSYITLSIRQNGESISQKTYSAANTKLPIVGLGVHDREYFQYAYCVPLHKGDIVGPWFQAGGIGTLIFYPSTTTTNNFRVTLMGLGYGALVGKVFDQTTGLPIAGATLSYTMGFGGSTTSDAEGLYEFTELTPGPYTITASKSGYTSLSRDVEIVFDDVAYLDFNLSP